MGEIHEFFAITKGTNAQSMYRVLDQKDEKGMPIVEKIALEGSSGIPLGGKLKGGTHLLISRLGIFPSSKNNATGGGTTPIVALFLRKDEAMECFKMLDFHWLDLRWRKKTEEVLEMIGNNHPVFILSDSNPIVYEN